MYKFSTSMMCANAFELETKFPIIDKYTDRYHMDIMDGHFVPNLALSIDFLRELKKRTKKPIDMHLMVDNPLAYIDELIEIGVTSISFHPHKISSNVFRIINLLKSKNIKFGVAISPSFSLDDLKYYIHHIDRITIMTVEPGFAGQKMITETLNKIKEVKTLKEKFNYEYQIEVDGSNNFKTFETYMDFGTEVFILGTGLFNYENIEEGFKEIRGFVDELNKKNKQ